MIIEKREQIFCDLCGKEIPPAIMPAYLGIKKTTEIIIGGHIILKNNQQKLDFHGECLGRFLNKIETDKKDYEPTNN